MPEVRDRWAGPVGTGDLAVGFGIRRGVVLRSRNVRGQNQHRSLSDDKENIPPESSRSARRRTRPRKSPLPSWYPRTPLRDITAVVNALERRRTRLRAAAELRRRNQESPNYSPVPFVSTPSRQERSISEQMPLPIQDQDLLINISDFPTSPSTIIKSSSQPVENPPEISPSIKSLVVHNTEVTDVEKKCMDLIEEFEKVVRENLQRILKTPTKKKPERSTLMSMR
ncbi:protein POLYCHOME-like [Magnolia sinica]|uniref:protein POLYCHOME-like n=1 Tax=Magnolia sinica TaxID=86752 RepID=UPI002659253E|nr:protein POLYCHOME-like [Magnolia sinica]